MVGKVFAKKNSNMIIAPSILAVGISIDVLVKNIDAQRKAINMALTDDRFW